MHTLTETLHRDSFYAYENSQGLLLVCNSFFAELMNRGSLPKKIKVTISTRRIPGAARVPVRVAKSGNVEWIDWDGMVHLLYYFTAGYLRRIGVRTGRWTDVWVDWAPVSPKEQHNVL